MQGAICEAIRNRNVIASDGDLTLSAWQLSGTGQGWRDFHVSKLTGLSTTGRTFAGPRPGYNPWDDTIDRVVCRL